ncbi:hypothetical protein SA21239_1410 [Staphylococcus aureus subsp. aureus 21239]|nr:hypothetical protein SA21239_1410 [Staphylococcus aureus subsp. aureus 21239]
MLFILAVVGGAPTSEAGGKSANNIVQVRAGPQHKEKLFPLEIITST